MSIASKQLLMKEFFDEVRQHKFQGTFGEYKIFKEQKINISINKNDDSAVLFDQSLLKEEATEVSILGVTPIPPLFYPLPDISPPFLGEPITEIPCQEKPKIMFLEPIVRVRSEIPLPPPIPMAFFENAENKNLCIEYFPERDMYKRNDVILIDKFKSKTGKKFTVVKFAGWGGFSNTFLVEDERRKYHILKIIQFSFQEDVDDFNKLMLRLKSLAGGDLILPEDYCVLNENTGYILMEYIDGKNLIELPKEFFTDDKMEQLVHDISKELLFMHSKGFIHGDIKGENIMYDSKINRFRLIDFDLVVTKSERGTNPINEMTFGTPGFIAPEVGHKFFKRFYSKYHDSPAIDIYAFGVSLKELGLSKKRNTQWRKFANQCTRTFPGLRPTLTKNKYVNKLFNQKCRSVV